MSTRSISIMSKEKFSCKICEREYLGKGALQAHERNAHSSEQELQLFCDICTKTFGNTLSLENHVQSIHKEMKVSCDQCERIFSLKSSLYTHKKSIHAGAIFTCEICSSELRSKQALLKHVKSKHYESENRPMLSCKICAWTCSSQGGNLKAHLKTHISEKSNKCNQCDYASSEASYLTIFHKISWKLPKHKNIQFNHIAPNLQ